MSVSLVEMRRQLVEEITRLTELVRSIDKARGVGAVPGTTMKDGSVGLLDTLPVGMVLGTDPESGKQITVAKKRVQPESAKLAISKFQKARHARIRAEKEAKANAAAEKASGNPSGTQAVQETK
jgi:hypothetical protein